MNENYREYRMKNQFRTFFVLLLTRKGILFRIICNYKLIISFSIITLEFIITLNFDQCSYTK
jgi:hypothetical protein